MEAERISGVHGILQEVNFNMYGNLRRYEGIKDY